MKKYYSCDCGTEVMEIQRDDDYQIYFAIFEWGTKNIPLSNRLKWCYRALFKHKYYGDQIILNLKEARKLGKDLIDLTQEGEKNNE